MSLPLVLQQQIYSANESIGTIHIKTYFLKAFKIPSFRHNWKPRKLGDARKQRIIR